MRKIFILVCALVMLTAMTVPGRAAGLAVSVAVAPQKYFVERIAGPSVQVTVLVPANADAHTYEPKPSQMTGMARSKVFFAVGLEFEQAWLPRLKAANPNILVVPTDAGIEKMMIKDDDHDHGPAKGAALKGADELEPDPHIWTSPALVRIQARNIAEGLIKADPVNKAAYQAGLARFLAEIDALDARIRQSFQSLKPGAEFMVFHPAWGYFAKDYGLTQVALEVHGREPGPRQLKELVEHARGMSYKVIFVQPQMSAKTAKTVADAIGAKIVPADPMVENWAANLTDIAAKFRNAAR